MATQSEEADDQRQKQVKLVAALLQKDADCTRVLSRDCHDMGVDPRKPLLLRSCERHSPLVEDLMVNISHLTEWLAAGCSCDASCPHPPTHSHSLYLYDMAAAQGNIDVLCTLPALYDDIKPRDQIASTGEDNQHPVAQQPNDEAIISHLFDEGSSSQLPEEMLTPQMNDELAASRLKDEVTSPQRRKGEINPQTNDVVLRLKSSDEKMTSVSLDNGQTSGRNEKVMDISETITTKSRPEITEPYFQCTSGSTSDVHDLSQNGEQLWSGYTENTADSLQNLRREEMSRSLPTESPDRNFTEKAQENAAESNAYNPSLCRRSEEDRVKNHDQAAASGILQHLTHDTKGGLVLDLEDIIFQDEDEEVFFDAYDVFFHEENTAKEPQTGNSHHNNAKKNAATRANGTQPKDAEEEEIFADAVETLDAREDNPKSLTCEAVKKKEVPIKALEPSFLAKETFTSDHQISNHRGQPSSCPEISSTFPDAADAIGNQETSVSLFATTAAAAETSRHSNSHVNRACRHTDRLSCSSRREIVRSAVRQYVQHHSDLDKLVRVLKCQPCSEDVADVFDVLEKSPEIQPGLFNVVQEFEHVIGAHSGRPLLLPACRVSIETSLPSPLTQTDTNICETSVQSSVTQTDTDIRETSVQSPQRQTDTDIRETSVQLSVTQTDTAICGTSLQADTDTRETSIQSSVRQTETDIRETSVQSPLTRTDNDISVTSLQAPLTQTDTDVSETSMLSLLNTTDTDVFETSIPSSPNPREADTCETSLQSAVTRTDADLGATAVDDPIPIQHLSLCKEEDADIQHKMAQCIRRYQQAHGCCRADLRMFPALFCPGSLLVGPSDNPDDDRFIRKSQSRLCQLMWTTPEHCHKEIEELSPLFDQEITIRICTNSCRRVLFPDFLSDAGIDPLVLFEDSCQNNKDLFQCIEKGECSCSWSSRYSVTFLPACAAAAAGNMDLFRRMLQMFVMRVLTKNRAEPRGQVQGGKSALRRGKGVCDEVPRKWKILRFNTSTVTFHSDRLLAQALRHALYANQLREVLRVLDDPQFQSAIPLTDDAKMSLLDLALRLGDDDMFRELLDRFGPDIQGDSDGLTPLLLAVWGGRMDLARTVLARGPRRGAETKEGLSALQLALRWKDTNESDKMALMLLEEGEGRTDPDDPRLPTALELAMSYKRYALLDFLAERGDVSVPDVVRRRKTGDFAVLQPWSPAVSWCCVRGCHLSVAGYLIDKGLDYLTAVAQQPQTINGDSRTPLQGVAIFKTEEACSLLDKLIEKGADVNEKTLKGYTPLVIAMKSSSLKALGKLISAGAILDSPQPPGCCTENGGDGAALDASGSASTQSGSGSSSATENGSGSVLSPLQQSLRNEETKNASLLWHALQTRHFQVAEIALMGGYRVHREAWYVKGEFPGTTPQEVKGNLERLSRQPLTLLNLCRRRLRGSVGSRLSAFLRDARLPQAVTDFIIMKELVDMFLK